MVEPTVQKELIELLDVLSRAQQEDVLNFAKSLRARREIARLLAELRASTDLNEKKRIRRELRRLGHRGGLGKRHRSGTAAVGVKKLPTMTGAELLKYAGILSEETADRMERAIKEHCERIDYSGW